MCLAKAYTSPDAAEPILGDIARIIVEDGRVTLTSLFGETKVVVGRIQQVDFMKSQIILDTAPATIRS